MKIDEIDQYLDVDYKRLLSRFSDNKMLLIKFMKKFLDDETYSALKHSVEEENYEKILTNAHTLKGISANLGFDRLSGFCAEIVSSIREGNHAKVLPAYQKAAKEYQLVVGVIEKLQE